MEVYQPRRQYNYAMVVQADQDVSIDFASGVITFGSINVQDNDYLIIYDIESDETVANIMDLDGTQDEDILERANRAIEKYETSNFPESKDT